MIGFINRDQKAIRRDRMQREIPATPAMARPDGSLVRDPALHNDWHVVGRAEECIRGKHLDVRLCGRAYTIARLDDGSLRTVGEPADTRGNEPAGDPPPGTSVEPAL